jgi:hypothetical protein
VTGGPAIAAGCWSPSATSRRPRPSNTTTQPWTNQLWRRDSNETASGKPGAVQAAQGMLNASSSILIVVGRIDTGELEAQVRGSRHSWDVRVISVDALLKLARLKQETDDPETAEKIRALFIPVDYTRLDVCLSLWNSDDVYYATLN